MDDFIVIPVEFLGNADEGGVFGDWIVGILFVIHVSQLMSIWGQLFLLEEVLSQGFGDWIASNLFGC